jgi:TIGR03009 family protein
MCTIVRYWFVAPVFALIVVSNATGQQYAPQQQPGAPQYVQPQMTVPTQQAQTQPAQPQPAQQPVQPAVPPGFQLNALQQAQLDAVLDQWQTASSTITTFECSFQRWDYDVAFGPQNGNIPLNKNVGKLSYQKPDKGSFEITEVNTFKQQPAQPGAAPIGNWEKQPDAIGDHWVCDGTSVYQYRPDLKQLVEHPIPPQFQGQAIVDGPLPFLFGADKEKLKARYWLRIDQTPNQDPNQIMLVARPRFREQAADFTQVDVILDKTRMMPQYMQVWKPNGSRDVYIFEIANANVNGLFNRAKALLFSRPSLPSGWKRVVQNMPLQQAAQPAPAPK